MSLEERSGGGGAEMTATAVPPAQRTHSGWRLLGIAAGIFCCYFYFGIYQEKITRSKYGPDEEPFTYTQALVFVQCLVNAIVAAGLIVASRPAVDDTPSEMYAACSFSYLVAMIASNHALQFIPYPTQVLGKSCKPIPVMLMGVLFARKRYPSAKYAYVLLIVIGCALFLYKDSKASSSASAFQLGWGELLLLLSLTMDGTTGSIQERIRASHTTSANHMMLNMNLWSTLYLLIGLLFTGELWTFAEFVQRHPSILWDMVSFSFASAAGQFFIFLMVTDFGPLPCSIVTTTRKFFTILFSVLWFRNSLSGRQWLGTAFVFAGLALDMLFGKSKPGSVKAAKS